MSKKILVLFLFCLLLFACRKMEPSWEVDINAPLLKSSLGINNILPDSMIGINSDNSLSLVYNYSFYDFSFDSLVDFPDTISQKDFPLPGGFPVNPGQTFFNFSENSNLSISGAQITKVDFHSGFLALEVFSSIPEPVIVTYTIPNATNLGLPLQITETVPAAPPGTTASFVKLFDISGYSMNMSGPAGISANIITSNIKAMMHPSAHTYYLDSLDKFAFNVRFKDISIHYAKGYFGSHSFAFGPDTTGIDIFNKISSGTFDIENIKLHLNVENGFGADLQVTFDDITAINSKTSQAVSLNAGIIGQNINISRAVETGNPEQPVIPSVYSYNLDNSNISNLIENIPDMISYRIKVATNPMGNISSGNDFVYYNNPLKAILDMEIPLSLIASNLTLTDTVDFDLGENTGTIKSGTLSLYADNGFPFSAQIQLFLLNENMQVTDSLLFPDMIAAPPLNSNYMVIHPLRSVIQIPLPGEKISRLYQTKKMKVVARFNTNGASHHVKIYEQYRLDLKLTGDFSYLIQL